MYPDVNLNIHYTAPEWVWEKVGEVYAAMPYWQGNEGGPHWAGEGIKLHASVEPGGIQIYGVMPEEIWEGWFADMKMRLTAALGYEVGEPEDGYDFKYDFERS